MRKFRFESREKSFLVRSALLAILLLVTRGSAAAQSGPKGSGDSKEPSASISGRVTVEGKPLTGVIVSLGGGNSPGGGSLGRSTTDADGRFTISGVPAGEYTVSPFAAAMVLPGAMPFGPQGKPVNVADGEVIDRIDIAMIRGGVITGRVTDSNGRAVVAEMVQISQVDDQGRKHRLFGMNQLMYQTDDRGIYRVYGLSPGRYVVSAGRGAPGEVSAGSGHAYYPFTYHPGVTDESRAGIVDLTAGTEAINIDIPLGKPVVSYTATGHVVDADTGALVPDVQVGYSSVGAMSGRSTSWRTGFDGEFRVEGIIPGRYSAFAMGDDDHDIYSDPTPFDVVDADTAGIEVKVRKGASITGVAVIEGASDPAILEKLSQLRVFVMPASPQPITNPRWVNAAADGSFTIRGLGPGKIRINPAGAPKGLSLSRVEKDGADQAGGIEVAAGEQVTGVRMVLAYGSCVINGSVRVEGGPLPDNTQMFISVRRVSAGPPQQNKGATVDARGRFSVEGLVPGEYMLMLNTYTNSYPIPPRPSRGPAVQKSVTVTGESDPEVTLVLNVPPSGQNNQQ